MVREHIYPYLKHTMTGEITEAKNQTERTYEYQFKDNDHIKFYINVANGNYWTFELTRVKEKCCPDLQYKDPNTGNCIQASFDKANIIEMDTDDKYSITFEINKQ